MYMYIYTYCMFIEDHGVLYLLIGIFRFLVSILDLTNVLISAGKECINQQLSFIF